MNNNAQLTERDHHNMDAFLAHVLDGHKAGSITRASALGALAHVITAIDKGNIGEARQWLEEGRTFIAGD